MSLPYALSAILLFSVPHTNATIQFLYIFVTYNFCTTICYTAINLPYGSLSAMMTRDSKERDLLSVFRMGLSPMGRIIAVTCTMPLIKLFGNDQAAWVKVMSIWAAIAFLLLINCFVKCEETVHITARSEEKIPVGRSLKALVTNQYFWAVLLLWMFQSTNQAVVGTILPYYCKYVFHNDSWMYSTLYLSETIVLIVFTFLCPLLIFVGVLIVGVLYQLDKKYPAIMKDLQSAKRAASCNFLIFLFPQPFPAWLQSCAGNLFLALPAPVGRAFSVCAPCPPCREADIHKKFIAAALRLSALLYIINAEHIPVSPLPITERFR